MATNIIIDNSLNEVRPIPYKIYVALLNQTLVATTSGLLVIGKTYRIPTVLGSDNFSNVGFVSAGVDFVATGTTPTVWTNLTLVENQTDSAPVVTVMENTLGNIIWTRSRAGVYIATLANSMPQLKTFFTVSTQSQTSSVFTTENWAQPNAIAVYVRNETTPNVFEDGRFLDLGVEIRVYP